MGTFFNHGIAPLGGAKGVELMPWLELDSSSVGEQVQGNEVQTVSENAPPFYGCLRSSLFVVTWFFLNLMASFFSFWVELESR